MFAGIILIISHETTILLGEIPGNPQRFHREVRSKTPEETRMQLESLPHGDEGGCETTKESLWNTIVVWLLKGSGTGV